VLEARVAHDGADGVKALRWSALTLLSTQVSILSRRCSLLTICSGPNSMERFLVTLMQAALEPQYHVRPGRPAIPAVEETLMKAAGPPASRVRRIAGIMT
jgi:hypothetical protein